MTIVNIRPGTRWQVISRGVTPAELAVFEGSLNAVVAEITAARDGLSDLDTRLDNIRDTANAAATDAEFSALQAEVIAARDGLPDLDTRLDGIRDAGQATYNEVVAAREGSASLDAKLDIMESAAAATTAEVIAARSGSASLDARIESVLTTANAAQTKANAAATQISLNATNSNVTTLTNEIVAAREGEVSLDAKLDSLETDLDARADAVEAALDNVETIINWDRPADNLKFFTRSIVGGDVQALTPIDASELVWTDEGQAVKLTDPPDGIDYVRIAVRHKFYLEAARRYRVRWMVKRAVNSPDPLNDAIVPKLAWYESTLVASSTTPVTSLTPLAYTTGDGWNTISTVIARAAATGVDHVAPADARFCTPFLDAFGETQQTNLVLIDLEPLETEFYSPDLTALENQINALESIDSGNRLDVLETYHAAPDTQSFETKNDLVAATIGVTVNQVTVHGWDDVDDGLGALLTREASEPTPITAAWAANTAYVLGDEVTNDDGNIYLCIAAGTSAVSPATGPSGTGTYIVDGTVVWQYVSHIDWKAQSADGAWWQVAPQSLRRSTFKNRGTSSVVRYADDRMRDTVHLFDYIPVEEHADIIAGTRDSLIPWGEEVNGVKGAYDALPAFHAALAEFKSIDPDFVGAAGGIGPTLHLPMGKLYISGPIEIRGMCELVGSGGAYSADQSHGTLIQVAADQHGIIIHHYDTYDQSKAAQEWTTESPGFWQPTHNQDVPTKAYANWSVRVNHGNYYRCILSGRTEDTITSWAANTVYTVGTVRENGPVGDSYVYEVISVTGDATSAASGGPTGTGGSIVDNNVTWAYVRSYGPSGTGSDIVEYGGWTGDTLDTRSAHWAYQTSRYAIGDAVVNYPTSGGSSIYECVDVEAGANVPVDKPTHTSQATNVGVPGDWLYDDGYTWRFRAEGRGGTSTVLRNFSLRSLGGTHGHGIWLRARANIYDVRVSNFPHNGINIQGTTNSAFEYSGNCNNFKITGGRIVSNGRTGVAWDYGTGELKNYGSGIYVQGSDANQGMVLAVDCSNNGMWGFWDDSFLGNNFIGCHTNTNAYRARRTWPVDGVNWGWICADEKLGLTIPPSMDVPEIWMPISVYGGSSVPHPPGGPPTTGVPGPLWIENDPWLTEGGAYNDGLLIACYTESGDIARQNGVAIFGGFGPAEVIPGGSGQLFYSGGGYLRTRRLMFEQFDTKGTQYTMGFFGTGDRSGTGGDLLTSFQHSKWSPTAITTVLDHETGAMSSSAYYQTLPNTLQNFGRSAKVANAVYLRNLFLGTGGYLNPTATVDWAADTEYVEDDVVLSDGGRTYTCAIAGVSAAPGPTGTSTATVLDGGGVGWIYQPTTTARQVTMATAVPTTGVWAAGDFVFNAAPAAVGAPIGWRCLTSYAPGPPAVQATWQVLRDSASQQTLTNITAGFTLTGASSPYHTLVAGTFPATNMVCSLSTTSDNAGLSFRITRTAVGAGELTVGASLTFLAQNEWCVVVSDGTNWYLESRGRLQPDTLQETVNTDIAFTVTPFSTPQRIRHTGTLTANRTVTLSTTNAFAGLNYRITRTGAGDFNLNVGSGPLKALATGTWGDFTYDGSAWYLSAYGTL